jgi:uncharacterized membrane protein
VACTAKASKPPAPKRIGTAAQAITSAAALQYSIQTKKLEKSMSKANSIVAIYETHEQAEQAVKELQEAGVDMKSLSIAAKDMHTEEQVVGYYTTGDRMKHWGKLGAFWGGFWGLLFGSALFAIPGIGPILVAGPLVAWIVAALEGAVVVGGVSAVGAGLVSIGIPKDSVIKYETALKTDKFLLIVHGTSEEVAQAKDIIGGTKHSSYTVHGEVVHGEPVMSR